MTPIELPIRVATLYRFARLAAHPDEMAALRDKLALLCDAQRVRGTLLLAREGINGTIAGSDDAISRVLDELRRLPGCADLDARFSRAATFPFHRMKLRVKREIVTMGQPNIDPLASAGTYVAPHDWNALIAAPGTIVIDTRNDYEVAVGSFAGAINPSTPTFSDFPAWFRAERGRLMSAHSLKGGPPPKIAMFCTGGIRCEKSTAFLKAEGLDDVYHLQGGILNYLETVSPRDSLWQGECFVFDARVSVGHGLEQGTLGLCHACRRPVSEADRTSPQFEEGVSCPACHNQRSDAQRDRYRERQRQECFAATRGEVHVGSQG